MDGILYTRLTRYLIYWSKNMDKIDRLLEYIHRTNPEMTRQKLIEELVESGYSAKSIYFLAIQNSKSQKF